MSSLFWHDGTFLVLYSFVTLTSANERPRCMYIIYYAHTIFFSAANANYIFENRDTIYNVWFRNLVKLRRHHEISIGFALNYTRLQNLSILVVISWNYLPKIFTVKILYLPWKINHHFKMINFNMHSLSLISVFIAEQKNQFSIIIKKSFQDRN